MTQLEFSELSCKLTKTLSKDDKKNNGIYFTPPETIRTIYNIIEPHIKDVKNVLEPSCGSCEFITVLYSNHPDLFITGVEYNKPIYDNIKHFSNDKINIINDNFLKYKSNQKYDLIIGNPPYYVMKKSDVEKEYYKYFDGRPNIFILFIIKSIEFLNDNGIISFVLPKNFLNCLYYDKMRQYIYNNMTIIDIIECNDKYLETQQDTVIVIIKKTISNNNDSYVNKINNYTIFSTQENTKRIKELLVNSKSLKDIGCKITVGTVVWNEVKPLLCDDNSNDNSNDNSKCRLIYSSDIKNNKLCIKKYANSDKKNYINKTGFIKPLLVINRGYGVGKYNLEYCIINETERTEYLIENHLMCISHDDTDENLIKLFKNIIKSLDTDKTREFIKIYFGNSAINATELYYILPIYTIEI